MTNTSQVDTGEQIERYTQRFDRIFRAAATKHQAHERSGPVIRELVADPTFLTAVLDKHLRTPGALDTPNYPVVALEVTSTPYYELVVNCWIPLPSRETDVTTKAIHHHGELLLTTGTLFGPGYEHWMLAKPELLDDQTHLHRLRLLEHGQHALGGVAFVDAYVAHVPLYADSLTITVCLWSSRSQKTWKDSVKRVPILQRNAATLRALGARAGLSKALELKMIDTFDFYPAEGGFVGMPEREEFPRGPNEDYLHSLFHVIQQTGNEDLASTIEEQLADHGAHQGELVKNLLVRLQNGDPIEGRLSRGHFDVEHTNFRRADIEHALETQPA